MNGLVWSVGTVLDSLQVPGKVAPRTLLIVRTDAIGDFVLFTPALRYIRQKYSSFEITLLVQDKVGDLARECPYIDSLITFNAKKYRRNLFHKFLFLFRIHKGEYEVCLYPAYSRERIGDEIVLWTGAAERIGWNTSEPGMSIDEKERGDLAYNRLINGNYPKSTHELKRNRDFVAQLGCQIDSFVPELWLSGKAHPNIQTLWDEEGLTTKQVVAIAMDASESFKTWGKYNYVQLMEKLAKTSKRIAFILTGGADRSPDPPELIEALLAGGLIDMRGKTSLPELAELYTRCSLVVANDTGPLHVAIAVGTATVCVLGGGQFGRFAPYGDANRHKFVFKEMDCFGCGWDCVYESNRCVEGIEVTRVLEATSTFVISEPGT